MKNKGELTTQQIVVITILIASFSVILFLLFRLNLGEQTQSEICHNSVILKDKASLLGGGSLNCKTSYVCISGGGKCEGISATETVTINSNNKQEVMKAIAGKMAECWWMFGEGKVDYVGGILKPSVTCSICSVVAFDEELASNKLSYQDLYDYLQTTKKDPSQTYLKYLYNVYDLPSLKDFSGKPIDFGKNIEPGEKYVIVTGITYEENPFKWIASSLTFGDTKISLPPVLVKKSEVKDLQCNEFVTKA